MLRDRYYEAIDLLFKDIRETQDDAITKASDKIIDAISKGHTVHLYDTGHIIDSELYNRAGGFNLLRQFKYDLNITSGARVQEHLEKEKDRSLEGLASFALKSANIYPGDILFIGSVSGISFNVVDLALAAHNMGVIVIAITSVQYSKELESLHPSHKKLFEINSVLIDNCAPFGDSMLDVEGIKQKFVPASGLSAAYIMWAIMSDVLEGLLEKGLTPGILGSVNNPDNVQFNIDLEDDYKASGL